MMTDRGRLFHSFIVQPNRLEKVYKEFVAFDPQAMSRFTPSFEVFFTKTIQKLRAGGFHGVDDVPSTAPIVSQMWNLYQSEWNIESITLEFLSNSPIAKTLKQMHFGVTFPFYVWFTCLSPAVYTLFIMSAITVPSVLMGRLMTDSFYAEIIKQYYKRGQLFKTLFDNKIKSLSDYEDFIKEAHDSKLSYMFMNFAVNLTRGLRF